MADQRVIQQIMPATGWAAVYLLEADPWYIVAPLVGWALVSENDRDDTEQSVIGLDGGDYVDFVTESGDFYLYVCISEIDDEMRRVFVEEAQRKLARSRERQAAKAAKATR